jgi:hypothetical protein
MLNYVRSGAHGNAYRGRRDVYEALGYQENLEYRDFWSLYTDDGIAKRVVDSMPTAIWSDGVAVSDREEADDQLTDFERQSKELFERTEFHSIMRRADILASLGRYSVVFVGYDDVSSANELYKPVERVGGQESIIYLMPVSEINAQVYDWEDDTTSERFGKPRTYTLNIRTGDKAGTGTGSLTVHYSRVIHFTRDVLESEVFGLPALGPVFNYFFQLLLLAGGGAEAAWRNMDQGLALNLDPEVYVGPEKEEELDQRVERYLNGLDRVLKLQGITATPLGTDTHSFGPNVQTILDLIAGSLRIPRRILTGSEAGQLASSQDRNNLSDRINEDRRLYANGMVRDPVDHWIEIGALPQPRGGEYQVIWPDMDQLSLVEQAEVAETMANANKANVEANGRAVYRTNEIRAAISGLEPLEGEDIWEGKDWTEPEEEGSEISDSPDTEEREE